MSKFEEDFINRFGTDNRDAILAAANEHKNGVHDRPGSDEFRWAILICLGYDCMSENYEYHHITAPFSEIDAFLKENTDYISKHDGDVDFMALFCGVYNVYVGKEEVAI